LEGLKNIVEIINNCSFNNKESKSNNFLTVDDMDLDDFETTKPVEPSDQQVKPPPAIETFQLKPIETKKRHRHENQVSGFTLYIY
jgi:hypothetical protein